MILNFYKHFPEAELSDSFANEQFQSISQLLSDNPVTTIVGLPASGITILMRYLTNRLGGKVVFVDTYQMPEISQLQFFKRFAEELGIDEEAQDVEILVEKCRKRLTQLSKDKESITIIFNRFDAMKDVVDPRFFDQIRALQYINRGKIKILIGLCRLTEDVFLPHVSGSDLTYYSNQYLLPFYSEKDLRELIRLHGPVRKITPAKWKEAMELSGGHLQLLQLLLQTEYIKRPLDDPFIKLALQDIFEHFNKKNQAIIKSVVSQKAVLPPEQLIKLGLINLKDQEFSLFSPLLTEFVREQIHNKLSAKEQIFVNLMKQNLGKVVSKDKIFEILWKDNDEHATDWALDAFIYRIRKNPAFARLGFNIENHKGTGYSLLKA